MFCLSFLLVTLFAVAFMPCMFLPYQPYYYVVPSQRHYHEVRVQAAQDGSKPVPAEVTRAAR